ncbi:15416_t:CDS:1, partial [Dentiscutata heterogama]
IDIYHLHNQDQQLATLFEELNINEILREVLEYVELKDIDSIFTNNDLSILVTS